LPELLQSAGPLPVTQPSHGDLVQPGRIYVATPDTHMLLDGERIAVSRGPKEHHTRPAIDPLFRTAALTRGAHVIGVLLSGMLDDGTAGLQAIKQRRGVVVVQDPKDALYPSMPSSAVAHVPNVDHIVRAGDLADLIAKLAHMPIDPVDAGSPRIDRSFAHEQAVMDGAGNPMAHLRAIGMPSGYTCPDCHGALWEVGASQPRRFRCHTGHGFTINTLAAALAEVNDSAVFNALRGMQERQALLQEIANALRAEEGEQAERWSAELDRLDRHTAVLRAMHEGRDTVEQALAQGLPDAPGDQGSATPLPRDREGKQGEGDESREGS
jgi:two-component system chemotaxis response regulator CheB